LHGKLTCGPNEKNPRDLDIAIKIDYRGSISKVDRTDDYRLR
jgi:hypothetical protein